MVLGLVTWGTRTTGRSSYLRLQYCTIQYVYAPSYTVQMAGRQIQWHRHKAEAYVSSVMCAGKCCLWLDFLFWHLGGGGSRHKMLLECCLITKHKPSCNTSCFRSLETQGMNRITCPYRSVLTHVLTATVRSWKRIGNLTLQSLRQTELYGICWNLPLYYSISSTNNSNFLL